MVFLWKSILIVVAYSPLDYGKVFRMLWELISPLIQLSMVVEKLPKVVPPSGRVPGRGLLVLPILEARRQRNRGEIAKKGSRLEVFASRGINRRRGQPGGPPRVQAHPWRGIGGGRA